MVTTSGLEQTDSPIHEAWIFKRIAMIQTALIGPAQQWYLHLPLDIKKNWQAFCEISENIRLSTIANTSEIFTRKRNTCFW